MKKIAFVIYYHRQNFYSLNAIAGALETDNIFENLDFYFLSSQEEILETLKDLVKSYEKILVAISFFTTQLFEIREFVAKLRKNFQRKCLLIGGGSHPTGDPAGTLQIGFDFAVIGEGEETIVELINRLAKNEDFSVIKGIACKIEENKYIYTKKRTLIDLNRYPPFPIKNVRFGAIEITRGCPYVCYFCQTPYILGTTPRHRSIESICKYVQVLKDYYGDLTDIRFITPNAFSYGSEDGKTLKIDKLEKLLSQIRYTIGENARIFVGTFPSEVRPEHVNQDTLNLVLKYGNNDNITIGAQSGSQKILDLCHRGHSVEDIYKAVDLTLENHLKINVDFIFGLPGERNEDIELTIEMMKRISKKGARIHAHSFIPLPQTPFSREPTKKINREYRKEIENLISKGLAFGNWKTQERLAAKITKIYKNRKSR
ncbi:MAG: TIGR04013 family B12-binding domain/radical SAM domain-containing protein [Candidatus Thorarchaeota archaeon]